MHKKHILIMGNEEILISGLLHRLQKQKKLIVDQFTTKNINKIIAEIKRTEPDVILMDDSLTSRIYEIFFQLPEDHIYHLVIINSKENKIQILITQKVEIHTIADFIDVL